MKATGKMIYSTVEERKHGQMAQFMKEIINKERSMALEFIVGVMAPGMRESGKKIR